MALRCSPKIACSLCLDLLDVMKPISQHLILLTFRAAHSLPSVLVLDHISALGPQLQDALSTKSPCRWRSNTCPILDC